jgi:D-alanyl-D-alanine carboxypeptidase (penicillin-binding protein 5/6)
LLAVILAGCILCTSCGITKDSVSAYETENYNKALYKAESYTEDLCVVADDLNETGYSPVADSYTAGLFDVNEANTLYAENIHDRIYPASTTKILTAYVALKYGNLDDIVTVSQNATDFPADAQVCHLKAGDQLTLEDLLNGLLLYSGNDTAYAIAEHISGSVENFVELMNEEAYALGATESHFVTPHGLHDANHYTTAYDLYLIFSHCIQNQTFVDIISKDSYTANISNPTYGSHTETWTVTNFYSANLVSEPQGVTVIGGKTGYTGEAGYCLILYSIKSDKPYISIMMGCQNKPDLYANMTALLESAGQ